MGTSDSFVSFLLVHIFSFGIFLQTKNIVCFSPAQWCGTSIKILEGGGQDKILGGMKCMHAKHAKICEFCQFYAEIVKFGLILTHLYFFLGGGRGKPDGKK